MSNPIDLNILRQIMHDNQNSGCTLPTDPARQVYVDNAGTVKRGTSLQPGEAVSRVPQETFAYAGAARTEDRS